MAVDQQGGSWQQAGRHGGDIALLRPDQHEPMPGGAVAFGFGLEPSQESFFEFEHGKDLVGRDQRASGGSRGRREQHVFELVATGRQDGGAFVDFGWIEQIEDGEVLDSEDLVHALEAEAAFAIEEVGNMRLFKSSLLGQMESGELAAFDALQKDSAEVILQNFELHWGEYSTGDWAICLRLVSVRDSEQIYFSADERVRRYVSQGVERL
jgi:hypothetical protein